MSPAPRLFLRPTTTTITRSSLPPHLPHDIQQFLLHYPTSTPSPSNSNLLFYTLETPALPCQLLLPALHAHLKGNYVELERNHGFIQWLFPIREMGMNWESSPLELHEITAIRSDERAMERLRESYEIMLDFYGMKLNCFWSGELGRKDQGWEGRYANLERNGHNYLRITRILKSLSELGWDHLVAPFLLFVLVERAGGELGKGVGRSMEGYWRWCLRDQGEREWVGSKIERVGRGEGWGMEDYKEAVKRREVTGSFKEVGEGGENRGEVGGENRGEVGGSQ